jgi:hypothetical protein
MGDHYQAKAVPGIGDGLGFDVWMFVTVCSGVCIVDWIHNLHHILLSTPELAERHRSASASVWCSSNVSVGIKKGRRVWELFADMAAIPCIEDFTCLPYNKLSEAIGRKVLELNHEDVAGGLSNCYHSLVIQMQRRKEACLCAEKLALKEYTEGSYIVGAQASQMSTALGLAREALFYSTLAPQLQTTLPTNSIPACFYARGDMSSGAKLVLLEDMMTCDDGQGSVNSGPAVDSRVDEGRRKQAFQAAQKQAADAWAATIAQGGPS